MIIIRLRAYTVQSHLVCPLCCPLLTTAATTITTMFYHVNQSAVTLVTKQVKYVCVLFFMDANYKYLAKFWYSTP